MPEAGYFCADEESANLCAALVLAGTKTATCGMDYWYSHTDRARPKIGELFIVTTWSGAPVCIIETTSVSTCPYNQVGEDFAYAEGEGDRSLAWWRAAHWEFFSQECEPLDISPTEDMLLHLERFRVVYPTP